MRSRNPKRSNGQGVDTSMLPGLKQGIFSVLGRLSVQENVRRATILNRGAEVGSLPVDSRESSKTKPKDGGSSLPLQKSAFGVAEEPVGFRRKRKKKRRTD